MKRVLALLLLIGAAVSLGEGVHAVKNGFTVRRIALPLDAPWEIWNEEAELALNQPYRFLGRGRQCFAFESLDGKYVLKLPRTDIYHTPFWLRVIPGFEKRRDSISRARREKKEFIYRSISIAHERLQEETGVFALHFGQTENRGKKITLIDSLGWTYYLPACSTSFILQKKHPLLMKAFLDALRNGDRSEAEQILKAFIDVVVARGRKGVGNKDGSFLRNYGYDGKAGYLIDIGTFCLKEDATSSIQDTMHPVRLWLQKKDMALLERFDKTLEEKLQSP